MISEIILHVGYPKTATTTIQKFLVKHIKHIPNVDIFSLNPDGSFNPSGNSQKQLPYTEEQFLLKEFKHWKLQALKNYLHKNQQSEDSKKIIISAERFIIASKDSLAQLKRTLLNYSAKVTVIVYLRRQDEAALSFFQESMKPNRVMSRLWGTDSYFPTKEQALNYFDYSLSLNKFESVFGLENIKPRLFCRSQFVSGNIIIDFLTAANINVSPIIMRAANRFKDVNVTLSRLQLLTLKTIQLNYDRDFYKYAFKNIGQVACEEKLSVCPQQSSEFINIFESSNRDVFERYKFSNEYKFKPIEISRNQRNDTITNSDNRIIELFVNQTLSSFEQDKYVSSLKKSSKLVKSVDIELSIELLSLANLIRPGGKTINSRLLKYKSERKLNV